MENAAGSHVTGFEAELAVRPVEGLRLRSTLSFSGTPFENVPETTFFAAADYRIPLGGEHALDLHAEYQFIDSIRIQDNTRASRSGDQLTAPAYDRINASVSFDAGHGLLARSGNANHAMLALLPLLLLSFLTVLRLSRPRAVAVDISLPVARPL